MSGPAIDDKVDRNVVAVDMPPVVETNPKRPAVIGPDFLAVDETDQPKLIVSEVPQDVRHAPLGLPRLSGQLLGRLLELHKSGWLRQRQRRSLREGPQAEHDPHDPSHQPTITQTLYGH